MTERSITITAAVAIVLWAAGMTLAVTNVFIGDKHDISAVAVCFACGAATLTVKGWLDRSVKHTANVFRLGKEAQRRESELEGGGPLRGL